MQRLFFIIILIALSPSSHGTAQKAFAQIRPLIFQIKTSSSSNLGKSSYGTGFVVDKNGLLVTNYHVIADTIWSEENNKAFIEIGGEILPLELRAVDFVRDLAVVAVKYTFDSQINLAPQMPSHGDDIYSMGLPADVDWTVIAGVYNGSVHQGPYELIHMSTPLNPGMSGGPTVNSNNQLVAVNVSGLRSMQQISFGIPVKFVREILNRAKDKQITNDEILLSLKSQLLGLQDRMTEEIMGALKKTKMVEEIRIPDYGKSVRCWGRNANEDKDPKYVGEGEVCSLEHNVSLDKGQFTGTFESRFAILKNKSLSWWSWMTLIASNWNPNQEIVPSFDKDDKLHYKQPQCFRERVTNTNQQIRTVNLCLQQMDPLTELYDGYLQVYDLSEAKQLRGAGFTFAGFTKANIKKITTGVINHSFKESQP